MTAIGWMQIALFCAIVVALVKPLGGFMTRVFTGERTLLSPILGPVERSLYRLGGVDARVEQHWTTYAFAMLLFNLAGFLLLYALQRLQPVLPLNPQDMPAVPPDLAFNTAVSFVTNTNWQNYGGEATLGYLVQMAGLTVQNFVSAATGIALAVALIRGFARRSASGIGNFWADLTRTTLYVLLPICVVYTLFLVWQGVPQNLSAYVDAATLEGARQTLAQGPIASQEAIKMLGTNGGGFLNVNSAHPYENPTPLTNLIEMVSIFAIGAALTNVFGRMVGDERQGWAILAAMAVIFVAGVAVAYAAEAAGTPALSALGLDGGNMEGKEVRFGIPLSALFAVVTTAASCGAVNAMHDSFTALGGMIPIINMELGEIVIGGVGAGLYGMLLFVIVATFVAGLMVGRTPEYRRQEDRGEGGEDDHAGHPRPAALDALLHRTRRGPAGRHVEHLESWPARLLGGALRLHVGDGEQWQRVRRPDRQYAVLQHDARPRDADRPLHDDRADAGGRGLAGREEVRAGLGGHLPDR